MLQKANLAHDRLTKYLGELVEKKLSSENEDNGNRYYSLTAEGIKLLNELKRAETFVSGFGLVVLVPASFLIVSSSGHSVVVPFLQSLGPSFRRI